jgi:hypothetical protein
MPDTTPLFIDELSPDPLELLRHLDAETRIPGRWEDHRFRARVGQLVRSGWARVVHGFVYITPEGRRHLRGEAPADRPAPRLSPPPAPPVADPGLNEAQEDLIRRAWRAGGRMALEQADGRVVRALEGRGLAARREDEMELTEAGRAYGRRRFPGRRMRAGADDRPPREDRARPARTSPGAERGADERTRRLRTIRSAVATLRSLIEDDATLRIEDLEAPAADAFAALEELADRIERQADPRRITPR